MKLAQISQTNSLYSIYKNAYKNSQGVQQILDPKSWGDFVTKNQIDIWANDSEQVVGFCLWRDLEFEIEVLQVALDPSHQGRGEAKLYLSQFLNSRGNGKTIFLEVHEKNLAALHLYKSLGFKTYHRRPNYYPDGGGALLMSLIAAPKKFNGKLL